MHFTGITLDLWLTKQTAIDAVFEILSSADIKNINLDLTIGQGKPLKNRSFFSWVIFGSSLYKFRICNI